jgi:hypothetical protein
LQDYCTQSDDVAKRGIGQQFSIWRSLPRIFRTIAEKLGQEAPKLQKLTAKLNFLLADGPYLELLGIGAQEFF